jgi:hypothetical protein
MLNRYLSLIVAVVAPASAVTMLLAGAHPVGAVSLADRLPGIGLAVVALTLAVLCLRAVRTPSTRADAAMWSGLAAFFLVAAFASPHLGVWAAVATLSLALSSVARLLAGRRRPGDVSTSPIRRRIFA